MTPKEIEENDELISKFMGRENQKTVPYSRIWDLLMWVVEKIESIHDEHDGYYTVHISSDSCTIQGTNMWRYMKDPTYGTVYMISLTLDTKFISTYAAVVGFIKWYNNK
jgi:hypothetical protein